MGATYCKTFAEAKFKLERQLVELGLRLDPGVVEIGLGEDCRGVTIWHPGGDEHWVYSSFNLPVAIDPKEFDADYFAKQFIDQPCH